MSTVRKAAADARFFLNQFRSVVALAETLDASVALADEAEALERKAEELRKQVKAGEARVSEARKSLEGLEALREAKLNDIAALAAQVEKTLADASAEAQARASDIIGRAKKEAAALLATADAALADKTQAVALLTDEADEAEKRLKTATTAYETLKRKLA